MFFVQKQEWNDENGYYFDSGSISASIFARSERQAPEGDHF